MTLHDFLDLHYGANGDQALHLRLAKSDDVHMRSSDGETLLHVAVRRRRLSAVKILLDHGVDIDAKNAHGKSAYVHAIRRRFTELEKFLRERGADTSMNDADKFAIAVVNGRIDEAREILAAHPTVVRTGNPEEDRLLADVAGRNPLEPVSFLIAAGADLSATALDDGTPLHQAAWFGQPANASALIEAGAPLEAFDQVHMSSPIGWAVHGSRYSGGAEERQEVYVRIVQMFLDAGAKLHYPGTSEKDDYLKRLRKDATLPVRKILPDQL